MARVSIVTADDLLQFGLENLRRLWADLPEIYQWALVRHPRTPPLLLWHALKSSKFWEWNLGYVRDDFPAEFVWDLFLHQALVTGQINSDLVRHPSVPPELLEVLTELGGLNVRCALLDHRNVTDKVLARLSHDPDREIGHEARKKLRARRALRAIFRRA
ncbi:MAG: hypothetical protein AABZ63_04435 [Actinomycetota bacterium]